VLQALAVAARLPNGLTFANPPLSKYLLLGEYAVDYGVHRVLGINASPQDFVAQFRADPSELYLIARLSSAVIGSATAVGAYALGAAVGGRRVGAITAWLTAVAYLLVRDSHFGVDDALVTLLVTIGLVCCVRIARGGTRRDYVAGGALAGLAFAAKYDGIALPWLARWSERYTWRGADCVLAVTEVLAKRVEAVGVNREKIVVIPNGINPDHFGSEFDNEQAKRRLGLEGRLVLGFTGFLRDWHGLEKVVELLASANPGWHLLIVGDGPARDALEKRAMTLNVTNRLTITGVVGRDDVAAHVAAFDIALQPAVVDYASPLKLFEYMALGRPVVAPAQPNIMEILVDGENALLFDPRDPRGLGSAVERLCRDAGLRQRIGEAARRTIRSRRLTWADNATRVTELFAGLTGKRELSR